MNLHRFEVPLWDFIDFYARYYSTPVKEFHKATLVCTWFHEVFLDLPGIETLIVHIINELNKFSDLQDLNGEDLYNDEDYDGATEYDEEVMDLIKYHLYEWSYEYGHEVDDLSNEEYTIEDDDIVFELFLLFIAWIEMLADYFDDSFRQEELLEIRRINTDAFVYTFV